jgi:hypothetical protein
VGEGGGEDFGEEVMDQLLSRSGGTLHAITSTVSSRASNVS